MRDVLKGQTDYTVLVRMASTTGAPVTGLAHTDIDIAYTRTETDNDVVVIDVAPASLSALTDAHSDWGFKEVHSTDAPGLYRLDIADAVFASGAWEAVVTITDASGTDFYATDIGFRMVGQDKTAATVAADLSETSLRSIARIGRNYNNIYFVNTFGSDDDGFTPETAFSTIAGAKAAALAGDLIVVGPGSYNERDLLKNDVDYRLEHGAIIDYSGGAGPVFTDSGGAIRCRIFGRGQLLATGGVNVFEISNASSLVYVEAFEIFASTSGQASAIFINGAGEMHVECERRCGSTTYDAVVVGGGTLDVSADSLPHEAAESSIEAYSGATVRARVRELGHVDNLDATVEVTAEVITGSWSLDASSVAIIHGARFTHNGTMFVNGDASARVRLYDVDLQSNPNVPATQINAGGTFFMFGETRWTPSKVTSATIVDYSNNQNLRGTTYGNTLDVASTGEAALDFNNIKQATGATTLTNITVPVVTLTTTTTNLTTNNDKTGYALSGTQTFNVTGNITGNLSGSVGSVTGAVGSVTGAVGSVTGNVGGNVVGTVASVVGAVGSVTSAVTITGDAATVGTRLLTALELDGAVYRFTTNALEQGPTGSGTADWTADERTAIRTILGVPASGTTPDVPSAGALKVIDDFLDTEVATIIAKIGNPAGVSVSADIAQVLSTLDQDHQSRVARLDTAQAGGASSITLDVGASSVTDFYQGETISIFSGTGAGQARRITAYNGTTKVATAERAWKTPPDNTSAFIITMDTGPKVDSSLDVSGGGAGLDAAGVRAAIGMATADMDIQLQGIATSADAGVAAGNAAENEAQVASGNSAQAAGYLAPSHSGTMQAAGASSITLAVGASAVTDFYKGATVRASSQARRGIAYNGTTKVLTIDRPWATIPSGDYEVLRDAGPKVDASLQVTPDAVGSGGIGSVVIEERDYAIAD